jgi:hypothetical protein
MACGNGKIVVTLFEKDLYMNTSKIALLSVTLLATSPLLAVMNGANPSTGSNVPAPQATPTAPTSVGPNGAMHTGPAPTATSATPTAPAGTGTTPPTAAQAMGPNNTPGNTAEQQTNTPATEQPTPAETAQ